MSALIPHQINHADQSCRKPSLQNVNPVGVISQVYVVILKVPDVPSAHLHSLQAVLISRFIINLRRTQHSERSTEDDRFSHFSAPQFRMPPMASLAGNMGEPLEHGSFVVEREANAGESRPSLGSYRVDLRTIAAPEEDVSSPDEADWLHEENRQVQNAPIHGQRLPPLLALQAVDFTWKEGNHPGERIVDTDKLAPQLELTACSQPSDSVDIALHVTAVPDIKLECV